MAGFSMKPKEIVLEVETGEGEVLANPHLVAILDVDFVKYSVASAGETRTIKVTHKPSGKVKEFKTRTEFYGRDKKKSGGWLGEINADRKKPFTLDEFEIEDVQRVESLENILHSAKVMGLSSVKALGTDKYEAYIGEGASFRRGLSTLLEYKGNRTDTLKPLALDDVSEYIKKRFKAEVVTGIEADDKVVMRAYGDPNAVVVGIDKDYWGQPIKFFNVNEPDRGIVDCDCFGKLWVEGTGTKEKVRGHGRLFLYWQMCSDDKADNYKANCMSDVKWGAKSAYKALCGCKDDKEALTKVVEIFKTLYPEPKEVEGWRGNKFTIDWLYVLKEMWVMARMLRFDNDYLAIEEVLNGYEVDW